MNSRPAHSLWWLIIRSLLPSAASILFSSTGAILFVAVGILFWSVSYGTILPQSFDGQLATIYTNLVVRPIEVLTHTRAWDNGMTIIAYSLVGAAFYQILAGGINTYVDWRATRRYVQFGPRTMITRAHIDKPFFFRVAWQFTVSIIGVLFIALALPILRWGLGEIRRVVMSADTQNDAGRLLIVALLITVLLHCCIILARLYTMRTRLLGDDMVYESNSKT